MLRFIALVAIVAGLPPVEAQVALERVLDDVNLFRPTDLRHDPAGRLYVAEQPGRIRVYEDGTFAQDFLLIHDRVGEYKAEGGLLSFAFHPEYTDNGYVFVHYYAIDPRRSVLARFSRSPSDPLAADPDSELILLEIEQPLFNHNGGSISFGPDGYLYMALGDGGCCSDVFGNAQNTSTLLGSVLRLDVDKSGNGLNYGIPPDNPFAASSGAERKEIYAWGVRSPWRMTHDAETGDLWVGDVGQDRYEEISRVIRGGNYGWPIMEAGSCFEPPEECDTEGLELPVWEYGREDGSSVTGGYVYRGSLFPEVSGAYIYGDFVSGRIWALKGQGGTGSVSNVELLDTDLLISSFGVDGDGELYVLNLIGSDGKGEVYRFKRTAVSVEPPAPARQLPSLRVTGSNPFTVATSLEAHIPNGGHVRVVLYDVLGREVAVLFNRAMIGETTLPLRFRADRLAPGIYFVRLISAGGFVTERVVLAK